LAGDAKTWPSGSTLPSQARSAGGV